MPPTPLPFILAGPILRRVDPAFVSVWVALSKSAVITLEVCHGAPVDATPNAATFGFGGGETIYVAIPPATTSTTKIGTNLHIAVVTANLATQLTAGEVHSYRLSFDNGSDLKSLGLLADNNHPFRPHVALGYTPGALPSFVAPPDKVDDLVLLHGSCRKVHGGDRDAMAYIDAVIEETRGTAKRPHQLFLTGDQIYADDIPSALLQELTESAFALLGANEQVRVDASTTPSIFYDVTTANFPPGRRQELIKTSAKLTSTDAGSHLISFGEFCAAHLFAWSNAVWPDTLKSKAVVLNRNAPKPPIDALLSPFDSEYFEDAEDEWDTEVEKLAEYRKCLPQVRRALANIPVLMIFDDHEISDDWNFNGEWFSRVIFSGNVLGRSIIKNGLAAYVLFQAWGNDPAYYAQPPGSSLLSDIAGFFATSPAPDAVATSNFIAKLDAAPPILRWYYRVERPNYRFIVLDTRTRRSFPGDITPPALLGSDALDEQIPPTLQPRDATIIVSAAPVLGLPLLEKAFPLLADVLYRYHYIESWAKSLINPSTAIDDDKEEELLKFDIEAWAFDIEAFERLLARLYNLKSVVLLSGDVHYAFSTAMTYWRAGANPRRFAQFTSSALKNPSPFGIDVLKSSIGTLIFDNVDRSEAMLGWSAPVMPTQAPSLLDADLRNRLAQLPVMLPEGTEVSLDRDPDWAWRVNLQLDARADDGSPNSRPPVVPGPGFELDIQIGLQIDDTVYLLTLSVHAHYFLTPRAVVWESSVGKVTFERENQNLSARHALIYANPVGVNPLEPQEWLHHPIRIGAVTDTDVPKLEP